MNNFLNRVKLTYEELSESDPSISLDNITHAFVKVMAIIGAILGLYTYIKLTTDLHVLILVLVLPIGALIGGAIGYLILRTIPFLIIGNVLGVFIGLIYGVYLILAQVIQFLHNNAI